MGRRATREFILGFFGPWRHSLNQSHGWDLAVRRCREAQYLIDKGWNRDR